MKPASRRATPKSHDAKSRLVQTIHRIPNCLIIGARTINSLENLGGNTFLSRDGSTVEYMVKETGIDAQVTAELTSTGTLIVCERHLGRREDF